MRENEWLQNLSKQVTIPIFNFNAQSYCLVCILLFYRSLWVWRKEIEWHCCVIRDVTNKMCFWEIGWNTIHCINREYLRKWSMIGMGRAIEYRICTNKLLAGYKKIMVLRWRSIEIFCPKGGLLSKKNCQFIWI